MPLRQITVSVSVRVSVSVSVSVRVSGVTCEGTGALSPLRVLSVLKSLRDGHILTLHKQRHTGGKPSACTECDERVRCTWFVAETIPSG